MATRVLKTELVISGEKEYKEALRRANEELRSQKSALALVNSEYKGNLNSQEALTKKIEALSGTEKAYQRILEESRNGLQNARSHLEKYSAEVRAAEERLEGARAELENLNLSAEDSAKQHDILTEKLKEYEQELDGCKKNQELASESVANWRAKCDSAETSLNKTKIQLIENKKYLEEASNSTDHCANSIDEYGKKVKKTTKEVESASDANKEFANSNKDTSEAVEAFASTMLASGLGEKIKELRETMLDCVEAFAEFEAGLAKIETIADLSHVSMSKIKQEIEELSIETGKSTADLSEAVYQAISAGVDTANAVEFVRQATKLSVGGFTDAVVSVDVLTTALNSYKMTVEEVEQVSDYLITTQKLGKTSVDELASSVGKVIPIAAAYEMKMDNLSTAYAILTSNGIATSESTTYLKSMLNELGDSASEVSGTLREKTGLSFTELTKRGYSLGDVIQFLGDAVDNDKGAFNELWSSAEAGVGALTLLGAGTEKYNTVLREMQESLGATEEAYQTMTNTTQTAQQKLENSLQNLKATIGEQVRPQLQEMYETGALTLEQVDEFVQKNEYLVPLLESVAAAGTATLLIAGGSTAIIKTLIPLMKEVIATSSAIPWLGTATAITAVVAALIPLIAKMSEISNEAAQFRDETEELTASLQESVEAYKEQRSAIEENGTKTRDLVHQLEELLKTEGKSTVEKERILSLVNKLNEAIPDLGLGYDAVTNSIGMTVEELEKLADEQEKIQQYENSAKAYSEAYLQQKEVVKKLTEAEELLADVEERKTKILEKYDGQSRNISAAIAEEDSQIKIYRATIEELNQTLEETSSAMATMQNEMNLYSIETMNLLPVHQQEIEALLANAEALRSNQEAYSAEIARIEAVAGGYQEYADAVKGHVETVLEEMQGLQDAYQESYEAAYENIQKQIGLFDAMKIETSESIEDLISNLQSQVEYMNDYAENIRLAMEYGVDKGIVEKLADGSEESAAYLAAIVEDGGKNIEALNAEFAKVNQGKDAFAEAVAEMKSNYCEQMDELVREAERAVAEMAMYDESFEAAVNTCRGLMDGMDSVWNEVVSKHRNLAKAAREAYNDELDIHSPSRKFEWSAEMEMEGIESGIEKKRSTVLQMYKDLAQNSMEEYVSEMERLNTVKHDAAEHILLGFSGGIAGAGGENGAPMERLLEKIINLLSNQVGSNQEMRAGVQEINFYQPVKSPIETAREIKKIGRELAF